MPNLKKVAQVAGVSTATVSRVINKDPKVRAATRIKVQKVIDSLNYKPSRVAQRLRSKGRESKLIGLVLPDIENPFYVDMIKGIEESAYRHNYSVIIGNFSQNRERAELYIDILKSESVNGFIVAPVHSADEKVVELIKSGYNVVCVDRGLSVVEVDVVQVDNEAGTFEAIEHLIKLGHRRIAHIAGKAEIPTSKARIIGYKKALTTHHIPIDESLIVGKESNFQSGLELSAQLLDSPHPPTAIFTANNLLTLGALQTIHSRRLAIPQDIAIVGFDDMYWSMSLNPPLTAVRQNGYEIGRRATDLLIQRIAEPERPSVKIVLKTELMVRKSCGA